MEHVLTWLMRLSEAPDVARWLIGCLSVGVVALLLLVGLGIGAFLAARRR